MGYIKSNVDKYCGLTNIPKDDILDNIYNPVVRRSVNITIGVLNALMKKYGFTEKIVIEMPRDRNSDEEKERINSTQKKNEKELKSIEEKLKSYGIVVTDAMYRNHKKLREKLKLWNEQGGVCVYSGKPIRIEELIEKPELFQIDHIIPYSISLDNSRVNKVLVYAAENQSKGNQTPYGYLKNVQREFGYDRFKALVLDTYKDKALRKKRQNLLNTDDITKWEVVQGFISRNINDTRYASRVVLNVINDFCQANHPDTKVRTIRGAFTGQMRTQLKLPKNREESFAHHAEDAALIAYSQMGYDTYRTSLESMIDLETGEISGSAEAQEVLFSKGCQDLFYAKKWMIIRQEVLDAKNKVKYWHKVDRKPNRTLCDQTIRGTREYDGKTYKINKLHIREKEGFETFKKKIEGGKAADFLMARNDPKTFEQLLWIFDNYKGTDNRNAFVEYERETGEIIRKYAKNGNGPRIDSMKYMDGEAKSSIDISHKYGWESGSKKVILESLKPFRMDVYYNKTEEKYYFVGIKVSDCKYEKGRYVLDEVKYQAELEREGVLKPGQRLWESDVEFCLSFFKNEMIQYEKNGEIYEERFLSRTMPEQRNYIETKPINMKKFKEKKQNIVGLGKTKTVRKIRTDILGNRYICRKEKFSKEIE